MKFDLNAKAKRNPQQGDVVLLSRDRVRLLCYDDGRYFFVNLASGEQTSNDYRTIEELLDGMEIEEVFASDRLTLSVN